MASITYRANRTAIHQILQGRGPVQLEVANIGRNVEGRVRACLPVVSGRLRRSVESRLTKDSGEWSVEIFSAEPYATWIEDGKRFDPRSGKTIRVKVGPRPCFRDALKAAGLSRFRRVR